MDKSEYFEKQLELIGEERLENIDREQEFEAQERKPYDFSHRDFAVQFKDEDELLKSLGRQFRNRLVKLAPLAGWLRSWTPDYTKSGKKTVDENPGEDFWRIDDESLEKRSKLIEKSGSRTPDTETSPISPYVMKVEERLDYKERPVVVKLSHTGVLTKLYRTKNVAEWAMKYARECGLVQCVDGSYRAANEVSRKSWSKAYAVNKVCLEQLYSLCRRFGVVVPSQFSGEGSPVPEEELDDLELKKQELYCRVRLDSRMRTPGLTVDEVTAALSRNYRAVLYPMLERIRSYNEGRPDDEKQQFRFSVRMSRDGFNTKNGCRAYSPISMLKTRGHAEDGEECFEDAVEKRFGAKVREYDVHSSVSRIARLCNYGVWDEGNPDGYAFMFPGFAEKSAKNRAIAKNISMLYQFGHTGKLVTAAVARTCPEYVKSAGKGELEQTLEYWYGYVRDWTGESLGSVVFLCEDGVYSMVDAELKSMGVRFMRKFDCWVFPEGEGPGDSEMSELVRQCALRWRRTEWPEQKRILDELDSMGVR